MYWCHPVLNSVGPVMISVLNDYRFVTVMRTHSTSMPSPSGRQRLEKVPWHH
ncbi:hypothetical protein A2U01_0026044 [Trifolium medium]|uniref:Uncharacterized protein n=1 Tax=Trifolium medium TaxID=97028 RepID=A0A392P2F3_9FABA|nr:hypothetical protein [Trifolium medium]